MENIQTSDLTIVASLGEAVLLCVLNEEVDNPKTLALQYDLAMKTFAIDHIQKFLKFTPFEGVDVNSEPIQNYFQDLIYRKLPSEVFIESLVAFTKEEVSPIQKAYLIGLISQDVIEKAWKKHPIGTVTTRKDGKQYRKVGESGDVEKDWQLIIKEGKDKNKDENKGNKEPKSNTNTNTKESKKDLETHAKNTSEQALTNAIQNSADEEVRKVANEELDRRSKEEKPQEPENHKDGEKKPETKKEQTKGVDTKKEESPFTEKFRGLTDSQVQFYLGAPDGEVKNSAKEVLAERGLRTVTQEEYEKEFKDYSESVLEESDEGYKWYKKEANKIDSYLDKNPEIETSVGEYVGSLYKGIRRYLSDKEGYTTPDRGIQRSKEYIEQLTQNLSKLISDNKIDQDLTLFRSVNAVSFFTDLNIGDIYEDKSFSSTSLEKLAFGEFKIKILAKKGSSVANLSNLEESEFLIDKGSKFRVISGSLNNITVELL